MIIGYAARDGDKPEEVSSGLLAIWRPGSLDGEVPGLPEELRDRLYTIGTAVIAVITAAAPNIFPETGRGTT